MGSNPRLFEAFFRLSPTDARLINTGCTRLVGFCASLHAQRRDIHRRVAQAYET